MSKNITLEEVSFSYPGTSTDVLKNISINIRAGEKIAIVGENGAGKTTLVKLIEGLYPPTNGTMMIDDINYKDIEKKSLHNSIATVNQDFCHYALTITENITL